MESRKQILKSLGMLLEEVFRPDGFVPKGGATFVRRCSNELRVEIEILLEPISDGCIAEPTLSIIWGTYTDIDRECMSSLPYYVPDKKAYTARALARNFSHFADRSIWPDPVYIAAENIHEVRDKIAYAYRSTIRAIARDLADLKGFYEFVRNNPEEPGTWRQLLIFTLEKTIFGTALACSNLPPVESARSEFEADQIVWARRKFCTQ